MTLEKLDILSIRMSKDHPSRRDLLKAGAFGYAAMNLPTSLIAEESKAETPWLKKAREVDDWLHSMRIEGPEGQVSYKLAVGSDKAETNLYSGSAGVLYFLKAMNEFAPSDRVKTDAEGTTSYLLKSLDSLNDDSDLGLYTGACGLAQILEVPTYDPDERYAVLSRIGEHTLKRWSNRSSKPEPFASNDIISGLAGMALLAQDERSWVPISKGYGPGDRPGTLFLRRFCEELIKRADQSGKGWRWGHAQGVTRNMPNFSHGTAGVAYAFAAKYQGYGRPEVVTSPIEKYLIAALKGAQYLHSIADTSNGGYKVFYDNIVEPPLYYMGYCHGPIGTARLFIKLHQCLPKEDWLEWAERCAKSVMDSECERHETPGFWNNHGICCGNAGVAMFFMDMYRQTKKQVYLDYAKAHIAVIDAKATVDKQGRRWTWAENRKSPKVLSTQTGLMQGAAGVGLMYLNMHALEKGLAWKHRLPDDPWLMTKEPKPRL